MKSNLKSIIHSCLVVLGLAVLLFMIIAANTKPKVNNVNAIEINSSISLQAKVDFPGLKLVITNQDRFDWNDVTLVVNDTFKYHVDNIASGKQLQISIMEFADNNGMRIDPIHMHPRKITINCKVNTGLGKFETDI